MIVFEAPYPVVETLVYLPNPRLGDSESQRGSVQLKRMMDKSVRTYVVKRSARRRFQLVCEISRDKLEEIRQFVRVYAGDKMKFIDHNGDKWVGHIISNPVEAEGMGRRLSSPGGEKYRVNLIFEGKRE